MSTTPKLNTNLSFKQTVIRVLLIALAVIIAFVTFMQLSPTIANAQPIAPTTPTPRTPADNPSTPNRTNNTTNGGKPINVCGVISTCPRWIESYKSESNNPESLAKSVVKFILTFVYFAIYVSSAVAVAFIVFAGYRYITSQGDEKNTKPALDTLKNAVIGLVLAILSLTIVTLIGNFLTNFNF